MTLNEILQNLAQQFTQLRAKYGVSKLGVFGSYARGEATAASDVDVLVEFSRPIGWEIVDLNDELEAVLQKPVDLVTVNALKPQLKDQILEQVIYVDNTYEPA